MKVFVQVCFLLIACRLSAQTDDLMIVEFVDRAQGDGFAIEIYNPTNSSIDLSNYWVRVFNNGSTSSSSSTRLSGTLASKGTFIFGNNAYSSSCSTTQNGGGITGVNTEDAVAIVKGSASSTNWVDMINLYGVRVDPTVDGVPVALFRRKIIRRCDNTTRYTSTDGISLNSWPNTSAVNVTGWISLPDSCVIPGFKEPDFKLNVGFTKDLCQGESTTLDAGADYKTYSWSTGAKTRTINVSNAGTYTVWVDSAECKSGRDTFKINIDLKPIFNPGFDSTICQGRSITLDAGSFKSYLWQNADKTQTLGTNRTLSVSQTGNYIITVNKGLCSEATDTFNIMVEMPTELNVGFDSTLCIGQSITLDAGPGFKSYTWELEGIGNTFQQTLVATQEGRYIITVDQGKCTQAKDTFNLFFKPVPSFSIGRDTLICTDDDLIVSAPTGFAAYKWTKNASPLPVATNSFNAKNFGSGDYAVTVNEGGCDQFSASRKVTVAPPLARPALEDTTLCEGESLILDAGPDYDSYLWNTNETTRTITVRQAGSYSVLVKKRPCQASAQVAVRVQTCIKPKLSVYNVITPNGDGVNDVFFVEDIAFFGPVSVEIFNRWGQLVFSSPNYQNNWNGDNLPDGTYFFVVKPKRGSDPLTGALMILK